jgi:dinuclear metal center YbgI/SA1388 family protein
MKDASLENIVEFLDELLETSTVPDYPNAINGLQLANRGRVKKVAAAVDFSTTTVNRAIAERANLLIVHHGMFWSGLQSFTGKAYSRIRDLVEADVAVYSSHLPLDRHAKFGNNVLLAKTLDLTPSNGFAQFKDIFVGVQGENDVSTATLVERARAFSNAHGGSVVASTTTSDRVTRRWAICTGAGASADTLAEATKDGIDTLIVGEGPHWTAIDAEERNIAIIYMGHYASETLGVFALADAISREFGIDSVKISAPTGL